MRLGDERGHRLYPNWAHARDDAKEIARLAHTLGPELRPVRPEGREPVRIEGQLPLWVGPIPMVDETLEASPAASR
jgi:hypothetical protein